LSRLPFVRLQCLRLARACFHDPLFISKQVRWRQARRILPRVRGVVLDIGCGSRPYESLLGPAVTRYIGLDYPSTMGVQAQPDIYADGLALPVQDATIDTILCFEVLEYIRDPFLFFQEMRRVLRPSGQYILITPLMRGVSDEPKDRFRFTPQGLTMLAEHAGLQVGEISPCGGIWAMVGQRISSALAQYMKVGTSKRRSIMWRCGVVQCLGLGLDWLWPWSQESLHYITGGRKPGGTGWTVTS
jgi:SAM-dependent methyltransferase